MNKMPAVDGAARDDAVLSVFNLTGRVGGIEQVGGFTPLDGLLERLRGSSRESAQRCSSSSHARIGRTGVADG